MLRAKYLTGSQCILPKHNDNDVLLVYDTKEEADYFLIHNRNHDIDYHYEYMEKLPHIFLGCYIYPFMKLVEGEEIEEIKNFSIFKHKKEYKALLKKFASFLPRESKKWYHIYIAVSMYENSSRNLTEEQKQTAQEIHDNGITQELYDYIIDYLK